jgi:hypothetical protein
MSELQTCKFVGGPVDGSTALVDIRLKAIVRIGFNRKTFLYHRVEIRDGKSISTYEYHLSAKQGRYP